MFHALVKVKPLPSDSLYVLGYDVVAFPQITDLEVPSVHVLVVVASKLLLVPCKVEEGHVSSFLELIDSIC